MKAARRRCDNLLLALISDQLVRKTRSRTSQARHTATLGQSLHQMSHILPSLAAAWRSAATASSSAASSSSCRRCIRALQTGTSSSYSITRSRRSYASSTSSSSASPPTSVESPTLATNQPPSSPSQADLQKSATKTPRPKSKEKAPKAATKVEQQPPPTAEAHFRTEHELHAISSRTRRIVLSNPDTAKEIVQKMNLQTPDMVVMEIYCGGCSIELAILMEARSPDIGSISLQVRVCYPVNCLNYRT